MFFGGIPVLVLWEKKDIWGDVRKKKIDIWKCVFFSPPPKCLFFFLTSQMSIFSPLTWRGMPKCLFLFPPNVYFFFPMKISYFLPYCWKIDVHRLPPGHRTTNFFLYKKKFCEIFPVNPREVRSNSWNVGFFRKHPQKVNVYFFFLVEMCWCVDVLMTVFMTLCWRGDVLAIGLMCRSVEVLMCWCVDDCVDVLIWCVDVLMCRLTVLM